VRIENFGSEINSERARISATAVWEDNDRPPIELYIETIPEFAPFLTINPTPFLVAASIPAHHHGERRLFVNCEICPVLISGLHEAMGWQRHWFNPDRQPIKIESKFPVMQEDRAADLTTGAFLSGGVDSLSILRLNRLNVPHNHPASIKVCFLVYGFDIGWGPNAPDKQETWERALATTQEVAHDAAATLIPVWTNIRFLDDSIPFWMYQFHGAALASVAHAFDQRIRTTCIASTFDIATDVPYGSRPVLDRCFSSHRMLIKHEGIMYSRLEKAKILAEWSQALKSVRVCTYNPPGRLNCGKCEKCIRTMLTLVAVGALTKTPAFGCEDVSVELLRTVKIVRPTQNQVYRQIVPHLEAQGRQDLVSELQRMFRAYRRYVLLRPLRNWREPIKALDEQFLGGRLTRLWRSAHEVSE